MNSKLIKTVTLLAYPFSLICNDKAFASMVNVNCLMYFRYKNKGEENCSFMLWKLF